MRLKANAIRHSKIYLLVRKQFPELIFKNLRMLCTDYKNEKFTALLKYAYPFPSFVGGLAYLLLKLLVLIQRARVLNVIVQSVPDNINLKTS